MKRFKIKDLLIVSSLIVLLCYSIIVIIESLSKTEINMINLSSVFGSVIVATIFILDKASANNFKKSKYRTHLLRGLIILSVIFSGILTNELINKGFLSGKELFWQLATVFLALGSIVLIQTTQQRKFKTT